MKYTIEKSTGKVSLTAFNLFVKDVTDMEHIEYWEDRLDALQVPYVTAFRTANEGKIVYSIFCNTRKAGVFK